jgi:hypothetical protein
MPTLLQQQLSKALQSINQQYAAMVAGPMCEIKVHPAPFMRRYQICRVEYFNPTHPVVFYVGFAEKQRAFLLTGAPDNFVRMARGDGVTIEAPETAAQYAATSLEVTRSMSRLFYLVSSLDDVIIRPNLDEAGAKARDAFKQQFRAVIVPPTALAAGKDFQSTVYAVREQALERHTLVVSRKGDLKDEIAVLAQGLPLVYGH